MKDLTFIYWLYEINYFIVKENGIFVIYDDEGYISTLDEAYNYWEQLN